MNVAQLIRLLKKCDQSARVCTASHDQSEDEIDGFVTRIAETRLEDLNRDDGGYNSSGPVVVVRC